MKPGRSAILPGLALGFLFLLLQVRYLQSFLDYDQIVYLLNMRGAWKEPFFNPHHLHFEMGGVAFDEVIQRFCARCPLDDFAFHQRLRSILAGSAGVVGAYLLLQRLCDSRGIAAGGALLFASMHGYLHYAAKIDTGIYPAAWLPWMLWQADRLASGETRLWSGAFGLGFFLFFGAMLHQSLGFAGAAILLALILPAPARLIAPPIERHARRPRPAIGELRPKRNKGRVRAAVLAASTALVLIAGAYWIIGREYYNLPLDKPKISQVRGTTWNGYTLQRWVFAYLNPNSSFRPATWQWDPVYVLRGWTDGALSPLSPLPRYNRSRQFEYRLAAPLSATNLPFRILLIASGLSAAALLLAFLPLWRRFGPVFLALLLSVPAHFFLGAAIEPFFLEFWLLFWASWTLLTVLLLCWIAERLCALGLPAPRRPAALLLLVLAAVFGIHNWRYSLQPHAQTVYTEGLDYRKPELVRYFLSDSIYRLRRTERIRAFGLEKPPER